ncbi:putative diguanylate cyclase YegE [mine drainage metagenome]|uniref:Putative diguanylate cyclase YegE n=1 Tax=mine drainage metagenome TaxID=410659 RepID=A0A1J5RYX3_9ZZZZ
MNELRVLFAAISVGNMAKIIGHLQAEDCEVHYEQASDEVTLDGHLQQNWDVLLLGSSAELTIETVVYALRCRTLDIPLIVLNDGMEPLPLAEAMRLGAQDCIALDQMERLLPSMQREMVSAILRSNLREQVVADYLMQEIDQLILRGYDMRSLNERICRRMAELFDLKLVWIGARMEDGRVEPLASAGESAYLEGIGVRWDDTPQGQGITGRSIRGNKAETMSLDSPRFALWRERAERYGMRSALAMPLGIKNEVAGALVMYSAHENTFDKLTISRLSAFAGRVTVAMLGAQEQQELRLMQAAMNNAANAMFITRRDGVIEWMNEALSRYSGYTTDEITGSNPRIFNSGEHQPSFWSEMWTTVLDGNHWRGEIVNRSRTGGLYTVAQSISPLYDGKGELTHFLAVQQDISEKKRLEEEIHYLAYHDSLTHLPNRMLFRDRVQQAIAQAQRTQTKLAVMFIDLDGFKAVNDLHGHNNGDCLLESVAERIRVCVRSGDTVARLGGDEFTVLLRDVKDRESIRGVAKKLLDIAVQPYALDGEAEATVSFSIGISIYPEDGKNFDALLSRADQAMYKAKQGGKNRHLFCSEQT